MKNLRYEIAIKGNKMIKKKSHIVRYKVAGLRNKAAIVKI